MYCEGLGLTVVGCFTDHDGFDGVMLGIAGANYHFEFTTCRAHALRPSPTVEDLAVFYVPSQTDWQLLCARMRAAGFNVVASFNPYWDFGGRTFEDHDGYRIVLYNASWTRE